MKLSDIDFGTLQPIEGYGPGFFRLGGEQHPAPVLFTQKAVLQWGGYSDPAPLLALAGEVDVLLIGTGAQIAYLPEDLRTKLDTAGLGVEIMASAAACRTYNVLLSEGRRIAVALLDATQTP